MTYDINETLRILPQISWALLAFFLILSEIRVFREYRTVENTERPETGRDGFLPPPGNGYEHYINASTVVYILRKGFNQFRVYLVRGDTPNARLRQDKYGRYFKVRCPDEGRAERIAENLFA